MRYCGPQTLGLSFASGMYHQMQISNASLELFSSKPDFGARVRTGGDLTAGDRASVAATAVVVDAYVAFALRLATKPSWRRQLKVLLRSRSHMLYDPSAAPGDAVAGSVPKPTATESAAVQDWSRLLFRLGHPFAQQRAAAGN